MPRIVRDIQLLVNDDDDHLYGYRLSDGTEVRIGSSQPENAAEVVGAAGLDVGASLERRGAVFNGTSDDGAAIQDALHRRRGNPSVVTTQPAPRGSVSENRRRITRITYERT